MHSEHVHRAREPGEPSGDEHDGDRRPRPRHPGVCGGALAGAEHAQLEAEGRPPQQRVGAHGGRHGEQDAHVQIGAGHELRQPRPAREERRLREARPRLPQFAVQRLGHDQEPDEVHEERDQHLVHVAGEPDHRREPRPERARRDARGRGQHRHERRRRRGQSEGRPGGGEPADRDLPLAADVDDAGAEAERHPHAGEEVGRRLVERHRDAVHRAEGPGRQRGVGHEGAPARGEDERRAAEEGERDAGARQDEGAEPVAGEGGVERMAGHRTP